MGYFELALDVHFAGVVAWRCIELVEVGKALRGWMGESERQVHIKLDNVESWDLDNIPSLP